MTETPIRSLIPRLAVPTVISMLVTGIYNSADTYFVGRISTQATAAVGLVFTVMALIQALGFFCGQGSANYLARLLGAGKKQEASEVAVMGFAMALVIGLILAVGGNLQAERIADWIGATSSARPDTVAYMRIILMGAPFMTCQFVINNQLRFQGSALYAMIGLMCGAVINIALDPILMFGFHMGIRGAAIATVSGQAISFLALFIGSRMGSNIRLSIRNLKPNPGYIASISANGFVVSADINSGLNGDTGLSDCCVHSDLTVSIGMFKTGHFSGISNEVMKKRINCDIGIEIIGPIIQMPVV